MAILPRAPRFQHSPHQNRSWLLCRNQQINPKINVELQGTQNSQNSLEIEE